METIDLISSGKLSWVRKYFLFIQSIIFDCLRAIHHRTRDRKQVNGDYHDGNWAKALDKKRWNQAATLVDYVIPENKEYRNAMLDGEIVKSARDYYLFKLEKLNQVLGAYASKSESLIKPIAKNRINGEHHV